MALLTTGATPVAAQYNLIPPSGANNTLQTGGITFSELNRLNCETMEIVSSGGDVMSATVWQGENTGGAPVAGLNVGIQSVPNPAVVTLPNGSTYPDVTIGYDGDDYFAVVAYENNLEIFVDVYLITWTTTTVTATFSSTSSISGPPAGLILDYNRPTIDMYASGTAPYHFTDYIVAYEEKDISWLWNTSTRAGNISMGPTAPAITQHTGESDPPWVEVACIYEPPSTREYYLVFHTRPGGVRQITLNGYDGTTDVNTYSNTIASSGSVSSSTTHLLPRIAAQTVYDYTTPSCELLLAVAYQSINFGYTNVSYFGLYPSACGTPAVVDSVDFTSLSSGAKQIMPCITMPGTFFGSTANIGNLMGNIGFYSRDVETAIPATGNGEYAAVGIDNLSGNFVTGLGGTNVWGVNSGGLNNKFDFVSGKPLPYMAIASAHNTGRDLYTVWYTGPSGSGGTLQYKFAGNGAAPVFKTSITNINKQKEYTLFPNPATDYISVSGVTDADYKVMDMTGRLVGQGTLSVGGNPVTISALPVGNYLLLITEDGLTQQFKFTKQ